MRHKCCKHQNCKNLYFGLFREIQNLEFSNLEICFMWLSVGYTFKFQMLVQLNRQLSKNLTLWLFDQLCVNQIPLTTFKVSVALLDGSTYRKSLQHINLSEHKTDYFLTIWKIIDLLVFCHMNASMILWLLCSPFS